MLTSLLQFPFFSPSEGSGRVSFSHDLIAQALAAGSYLKKLTKDQCRFFDRLSSVDLQDPTLLRFMAKRFDHQVEKQLIDQIRAGRIGEDGFPTALSLLLLARPDRDLIALSKFQFAGRNLTGVLFSDRDLVDMHFSDCNLTNVAFENCNLTRTVFEGAVLNRTRFSHCVLEAAQFGNLRRVVSLLAGNQELHETNSIRRWVSEHTGVMLPHEDDSCPTARQFVHLFRKFITPLGQSRRIQLDKKGLLAGRRIEGAALIEACVHELVRQKYFLLTSSQRRLYSRARDDKYAEMVKAVKDGVLSEGLSHAISNLCRRMGCLHQLQ